MAQQLYVNPQTGEVSTVPKEGFVVDTTTGPAAPPKPTFDADITGEVQTQKPRRRPGETVDSFNKRTGNITDTLYEDLRNPGETRKDFKERWSSMDRRRPDMIDTQPAGVPPVVNQAPPEIPQGPSIETDPNTGATITTNPDGTIKGSDGTGNEFNLTETGNKLKEFFGIDNKFLSRSLLYYLGGRLTGGSHAGSLQWAGQQAIKELNARDAAQARAHAEADKAYNEKFGGKDEATISLQKLLESKGIDPKKATTKFVRTTGKDLGEVIETYTGPGGQYFYNPTSKELEKVDITGYEKYSVEQHSLSNVQKNLGNHVEKFVESGDFKVNVGDEDNPRFKYKVNPRSFSTAYTNWLKNTYGDNGYIYANTPEGRARAETMYEAAFNWSNRTGKDIKHYAGFFGALNSGIFGADGHANRQTPMLYKDPQGNNVSLSNYQGLDKLVTDFQTKHGAKTQGAVMSVALNAWESPQSEGERKLKQDILKKYEEGKLPKGTSPALEFIKLYLSK